MAVRINRFLAEHGIAARRTIDAMIVQGRITVNGKKLAAPGYFVTENDTIAVDGKKITSAQKEHVYILFNKPAGCITTSKDTHNRKTVLDYINVKERVFPIGRLDKDTTGVLLLTNDGDLANRLMHPSHEVEKVYRAHLDQPLNERDKKRFESGVLLDGRKTVPCRTRLFDNSRRDVIITLHEGRNRQIHRMFNTLGYIVEKLDRVSYAGITTGRLKHGEWRYLTKKEVEHVKQI